MREPDSSAAAAERRVISSGSRTFASLNHRNFRLLWFTSLLNAGSNWIQQVTLGWLAYDITGSALTAAIVFGARSIPSLVVGPIGGVIGDRFERKRVLQINSGYMAFLACCFAALLAFGTVHVWHLILFTILQGLGQSMVNPVRQAVVANTVPKEDLMNAIALNGFAFNIMRVLGPALAGLLIAFSGPALNFAIQGCAFMVVFILILPLRTPYTNLTGRHGHASFGDDFIGGMKYVAREPTIFGLILLAMIPPLFTTPINLGLLPVFAREVLNAEPSALGFLYSAQGIGAVAGTLYLASRGNYGRPGIVVSVAGIALAFSIMLYSQMTVFLFALPMLAIGTGCFMTYMTATQTMLQVITPDEYRGRVMGLQMMDHGLTPLGSFVFGTIAEFYGVATAMIIAGSCALTVMVVILLRFPSIRGYQNTMQHVHSSASEPPRARDAVPASATTAPAPATVARRD